MEKIFENAKWIGGNFDEHNSAIILSASFDTEKKYENVRLYATGLGIFKAYVNGKKVSDYYFEPGESNYGKRVYYDVYDIASLVKEGTNEIEIIVGNGQYVNFLVNPTMEKDGELIEPHRYQKNDSKIFWEGICGEKKAIAVVEADGEILSATGEGWRARKSHIVFQNWYGGEDCDRTRVFEEKAAVVMDTPKATLTKRFFPPVVEIERIKAEGIEKRGDSYIVDFGKNGAGVPHIKLETTEEMRGVKIKMIPSEELDEFGFADQRSCTQSWSETKKCEISDSYVIEGEGVEEWNPIFCYHGFRYLEVQGMPYEPKGDTFTYIRLRADNKKTGFFETDNEMLQKINLMTERSIESNMFFAFTDCPQIEKLGWLETSHLMFKSLVYGWDIKSWVEKIATDISDSVFEDGYVPAIVPEFFRINGLFRDVNWGGACVMTAWYAYEFYNDKKVLEIAFNAGEKYIEHLKGYMKEGLLRNYSQMGDWGQINDKTPTVLVENCAFYLLLNTFGRICEVLGYESEKYFELAEEIKKAFHKDSECYNKERKIYGTGSQSSYGCVLFSGIVIDEEDAVEKLAEKVKDDNYHLTSGEVGLKQVFSVLNKYGKDELVYKMVTNKERPGYGYFAEKNLTTLPEYWNYEEMWWGMVRSRNHAMMGHVREWLVGGVLGVQLEGNTLTVKPYVPENTTYAKGAFENHLGRFEIGWHINNGRVEIEVDAPKGVRVIRNQE